jgi:hypothetical protein
MVTRMCMMVLLCDIGMSLEKFNHGAIRRASSIAEHLHPKKRMMMTLKEAA